MGLVGPAFGLKGFVKVKPFSGEIEHFFNLHEVTLRQAGKDETWELAETALQGNSLLIRFAGIDSPEAAANLKGAEIIVGRKLASPLKEGEFYVEDLKGLEVIGRDGEILGYITDVIEGGGGNLVELKLLSGEIRLAPFRNEFFGDVDLENGKIVLLESWILDQ